MTTSGTGMQKDVLTGVLETLVNTARGAFGYAEAGVKLATEATSGNLLTDGRKTFSDVEETISDVKAGKWGEVVPDAGSVINDVVKLLGDAGVKVPLLGTVAAALPQLPTVAGVKAAKAA